MPPSKPKNINVTKSVVTENATFYPKITWDENIEPDFITPSQSPEVIPKYLVYRSVTSSCTGVQTYSFLAETDTNVYIDNSLLLYVSGSGSGACAYQFRAVSYKVTAKDNSNKESLKSERGVITGYLDPCGAADPRPVLNEEIKTYKLYANYPNPFNPGTNIQYDLPVDNFVTIKIYDLLGREVMTLVNEFKTVGRYIVSFDGSNLSSGIYYYKIKAGSFEQLSKMVLLK